MVYFLLAAASAGVFLHAGIKFPWFVFFQKDSGLRPQEAPWNMAVAMFIFASLCILIGVFPETFYAFLPYAMDYEPYQPGKVVFYLQLLLFSGLAFFILLPLMQRTLTISLDADWIWRVIGTKLWRLAIAQISKAKTLLFAMVERVAQALPASLDNAHFRRLQAVKTEPIAATSLWIGVLLIGYVVAYFI